MKSISYHLTVILLVAVAITGWVMNLVTIFNSDFGNITGVLVLRVVGIFLAPIGAVLGWF
jgi:hypothetical protein